MGEGSRVLRQSLWPLSFVWAMVASVRHYAFDAGLKKSFAVDVPVWSVGNLSVGGTGKTPTVAWLVRSLRELGRSPGVVARGYGRAEGAALNDEGMLLDQRFESLPQRQDPDRVAAAEGLIGEGRVDWIVLDDGFQHRRIRRDLDIVCLDAEKPFSGGLCLPAGDLRELPGGLRRAGLVIVTRAEGLSLERRERLTARVRRHARNDELPVHFATHLPVRLRFSDGTEAPVESLADREVDLLAAIAKPQSFVRTAESLGARVGAMHIKPDHHLHDPDEVRTLGRAAAERGALLLTTEKDAVKLPADAGFAVLEIDLEFLGAAPDLAKWMPRSDNDAQDQPDEEIE